MKRVSITCTAALLLTGLYLGSSTVLAEATEYPVTLTDQLGREVTISEKPESLVSGYYISTSMLLALGLEDQIVGIEAKADTRPIYALAAPDLLSLPDVGTAKEFNLEGCAALEPDLVIVPARLKDSISAMEELGLTVLAVNPEDEDLLLEALELVSTATDTSDRAEELSEFRDTKLNQLAAALDGCETPSVYLGSNSALLSTAGASMYQNTLIERSGAVNAAAELTGDNWEEISYEQLLAWNPEVILLAADASYTAADVLTDETLQELAAVTSEAVYEIPGEIEAWDSPVPGCFLGSLWGASVLHPDLYPAEDYQAAVTEYYETFYDFTPELSSSAQ